MNRVRIGEHDYLQYKDGSPIRPVEQGSVEVVHHMPNGEIQFFTFSNPELHNDLKQVMKEVG